jgi:hypothetical protein
LIVDKVTKDLSGAILEARISARVLGNAPDPPEITPGPQVVYKVYCYGGAVHVLDKCRPIFIAVDALLKSWLVENFLPVAMQLADDGAKTGSQPTPAAEGGLAMPSKIELRGGIREKVAWDVNKHSWRIYAKRPRVTLKDP